jgi:hypothetical protein
MAVIGGPTGAPGQEARMRNPTAIIGSAWKRRSNPSVTAGSSAKLAIRPRTSRRAGRAEARSSPPLTRSPIESIIVTSDEALRMAMAFEAFTVAPLASRASCSRGILLSAGR